MSSIKEHYENLLAANYVWAFGDHATNAARFNEFLSKFKIQPIEGACVVDLGCGPGYQSIALAESGFHVISIDMSPTLLQELRGRMGQLQIAPIEDDIMNFPVHCAHKNISLALCLGDVISHLSGMAQVTELFAKIHGCLMPGGHLLLGYRDQTTARQGTDRILPFFSDENKIMTTFIEYEQDYLNVTDVFYTRAARAWILEKSAYQKIRLRTEHIREQLQKAGFKIIDTAVVNDATAILAEK